ncbi:MAG: hypothetical protein IPI11_13475 [Haliscomenobacter sp.]|nr:hypothetical protein [Haliscomenobacter sp.]
MSLQICQRVLHPISMILTMLFRKKIIIIRNIPIRVLYVPKIANTKGQADKVIEFIKADSPEAQGLNKEYVLIKDREKPKYLPKQIIDKMKGQVAKKSSMHLHSNPGKPESQRKMEKGFGVK